MFTKEDYVSLETAKLLKEKGFDEEVNAYYGEKRGFVVDSSRRNYNDNGLCSIGYITKDIKLEFEDSFVSAPTLYEAQKWLIERYSLYVCPEPYLVKDSEECAWFMVEIFRKDGVYWEWLADADGNYVSYQQAFDAGIRKALELIEED